jgi:hypothetical protein
MSYAPSPDNSLPQPSAICNHPANGDVADPLAASESTSVSAALQSHPTVQTTTNAFHKGGSRESAQRQTKTTTTSASAPATDSAARSSYHQRSVDARHHKLNANHCSTEESRFARPVAEMFPWSSRAAPPQQQSGASVAVGANVDGQLMTRPMCSADDSARSSSNGGMDAPALANLSATPDKQRRGSEVGTMNDNQTEYSFNNNSTRQQQRPSQYLDPTAENGITAQPGDSSLVFALSEDSELKVLASCVGPPPPTAAASTRGAQPTVLNRTAHQAAAAATHSSAPSHHAGAVDLPLAAACPGIVGGFHGNSSNAGTGTSNVLNRTAPVLNQLQPHTPSIHRGARESDGALEEGSSSSCPGAAKPSVQVARTSQYPSSAGPSSGCASVPPPPSLAQQSQQHQQQPFPAKTSRASSGAPLYRAHPHELPSPPALHMYPGVVPVTGVVPLTTIAVNSISNSNNTRWVSSGIPSVSLYSPATTVTATAVAAAAAAAAANRAGNSTHSNVSSTAPEGSGAARSQPNKPIAPDARSLHSNTPPPPSTFHAQPIDKNFTPADLETVMKAVQQELYLNYTAVPIPADMMNLGETDERRRRLEQRRKQIVYGKETEGYAKYTTLVRRPCDREYHNPLHALTPRPEYDCSKRQFDRVLNTWRRQLHQWDDCDIDNPDPKFLPCGTATLGDLALVQAPAARTPTPTTMPDGKPPLQQQQQQQAGVMHSIANVAAMAHRHNGAGDDNNGGGQGGDVDEDNDGAPHARSPVFTGTTPTSALYSSGLSVHINSGRASAIAATACTPSRPQLSEGGEGPQVDDSFFLHMNSGSSRIASPFHPTYSGTGHVANGNSSGTSNCSYNYYGNGGAAVNGRSSANSYYQQLMRSTTCATAHTGLTPAHRPPSRSNVAHHITAIFGSEYELMTPSGLGSPSGMPHNPRNGGSPYRLSEPWMPNRHSPTYVMSSSVAQGPGHNMGTPSTSTATNINNNNLSPPACITAANSAGTMVMTGTRGESPPQTTELALIPSTLQSSSGGFAQSPYGFRVHSPVQLQQQAAQAGCCVTTTPLTRSQSRPGTTAAAASQTTSSPSRSPICLPPQLQRERVAITTTMAAVARSRQSSGLGMAPTTWTPPNPQAQVRPSPQAPQLHLTATPPSTTEPETQE